MPHVNGPVGQTVNGAALGSLLQVRVHTGDKKGAGADSSVFIQLRDSAGKETSVYELTDMNVSDHERDSLTVYQLPKNFADGLTDLESIILSHNISNNKSTDDRWFVNLVEVQKLPGGKLPIYGLGKLYPFPVNRWVHSGIDYRIQLYDISLPQTVDADMKKRRERELADKRRQYQYGQVIPNGPVQVHSYILAHATLC